jgi:indole-3-glycerol phosphate synthase
LAALITDQFVKVSESGISKVETVKELRKVGYKGFLMGENFMKEEDPAAALANFIENLQ